MEIILESEGREEKSEQFKYYKIEKVDDIESLAQYLKFYRNEAAVITKQLQIHIIMLAF